MIGFEIMAIGFYALLGIVAVISAAKLAQLIWINIKKKYGVKPRKYTGRG